MGTLWDSCLQLLQTKVSKQQMSTWLEPIHCEEESNDRMVLSVPNNFFISWIKENYLRHIQDKLLELTGTTCEIVLTSRNDSAPALETLEHEPDETAESPIRDVGITDEYAIKFNINPRYNFESFVVGACNQFARAAAMAVAENLGGTYNPLFLYGGVGLGKTHLMSAIGYDLLSKNKRCKVSFTTSEEFTNEMINAIRFDRMVEFRNKYRRLDLLLIDDIQFLAGKERTQEEFFHTFNRIYETRKQIVITADCLPNDLSDIEQRLRSRFSWGLVTDMGIPDLETRVAILRRKAFEYDSSLRVPDEVAYFLAENSPSNVRELVGNLVRVVAISQLQGIPLTLDLAKKALEHQIRQHTRPVTVDMIIGQVAKAFNVKTADIKSKKKHKLYSFPRQVGMYLARELTECSYPEIGVAFGGKDHSTVIYAARKIEQSIDKDPSLKAMIERLKLEIRS